MPGVHTGLERFVPPFVTGEKPHNTKTILDRPQEGTDLVVEVN